MKFTHKLVLLALSGALAAPLFIKDSNGKPLMTMDDWIPKDLFALFDKASNLKESASTVAGDGGNKNGKQLFYKWKDANGVWQMTQYRPSHLAPEAIEERTIYANANIIKSLDDAEISSILAQKPAQAKNKSKFAYNPDAPKDLLSKDDDDSSFSLTTVPVTKIPEMIKQAQGLDAKMQQRQQMIDQQIR